MARVVTVLLLLMLPVVVPAAAQEPKKLDPVIVTGTKIETPAEQVGATVTVIDGDEIETRLYPTVDEALRNVPGVEIRRSGSFGKTTSLSIRGANPNQVQILVDGVRVKSPDHRPGRPGRHRARVDRADRDHPRTPVDDLRRRRHRRRGADHHQEGQRAAHRVRVAGGRQLRHLPGQDWHQRRLEGLRLLARLLPPGVQRPHHQRRHEPERGGRPLRPRPAVGQHADRWRRPLQQDRHRRARSSSWATRCRSCRRSIPTRTRRARRTRRASTCARGR